jgi:hypothetical protein
MIDAGEIVFRDAPVAVFGKAQVPVQVRRIGVCGSDVHVYHGKHPFAPYPVVQGHKFSGIIWGYTGRNGSTHLQSILPVVHITTHSGTLIQRNIGDTLAAGVTALVEL